jgi:hypothetical protein
VLFLYASRLYGRRTSESSSPIISHLPWDVEYANGPRAASSRNGKIRLPHGAPVAAQGSEAHAANKVIAEDMSLDQSDTLPICNSANCVCPRNKSCLSDPRGTHGQAEMVRGMDISS